MYNGTYDDYIRSILGYPPNNSFYDNNYIMGNNDYRNEINNNMNYQMSINQNSELEKCYPEIYKIINPMVVKRCENVRGNVTSQDIEDITDEIFFAIEGKEEINLNINLTNDVRNSNTNSNPTDKTAKLTINDIKAEEGKSEKRQFNRGLRDLIKILLIRELLNRPGMNRPPRPPMPGPRPPMRPPFRPEPGRPPFNRDFEMMNYDIFEN